MRSVCAAACAALWLWWTASPMAAAMPISISERGEEIVEYKIPSGTEIHVESAPEDAEVRAGMNRFAEILVAATATAAAIAVLALVPRE